MTPTGPHTRPSDRLDEETAAAARHVIAAAAEHDGVAPFSEQALLNLPGGAGTRVLSRIGDRVAGVAWFDGDSGELVVEPQSRRRGVGSALLAELERSGVRLLWAHGRLPEAVRFAAHHRYTESRTLLQMALPVTGSLPEPDRGELQSAGIDIRPFVPGQDDAAWLAVNARAFAHHPEQGHWTPDDLAARTGADWFDPSGFLLAVSGATIVGFHWTKIHDAATGEIYVLGVDPGAQGRHLGRNLALAGLQHLRARGVQRVILYVEADQTPAVRLYESLGFERAAIDVQFGKNTA